MTLARWRVALWVLMLLVVVLAMWQARGALLPFAVGALLAYIITPVVDLFAAISPPRTRRGMVYRRGFIVLAIYALFIGAMLAAGSVIVPLAAQQTVEFIETLPETIRLANDEASRWLTQYRSNVPEDVRAQLEGYLDEAGTAVAAAVATVARNSLGWLTGTIAVVLGFAVTPFFMFYAIRDRHRVAYNFKRAVPAGLKSDVDNILTIADRVLIRYLRGQIFLGLCVGLAVGVTLTVMGVQMSLALGIFAGITELIPIIGPWIGAVPGIIIVLATNPDQIVWVAGVYLVVQQIENQLLVPRIQGMAVDIHPGMVLLLLVVAGSVFGFWGMLVILPVTAILRELFWYADSRLAGLDADTAFAHTHVGGSILAEGGMPPPEPLGAVDGDDFEEQEHVVEPVIPPPMP